MIYKLLSQSNYNQLEKLVQLYLRINVEVAIF